MGFILAPQEPSLLPSLEKKVQAVVDGNSLRLDLSNETVDKKNWDRIFQLKQLEYLDLSGSSLPRDFLEKGYLS